MTLQETRRDRGFGIDKDALTALDLNHPLRTELFAVATANWNAHFDPQVLQDLLQDPFGNHARLKSIRKSGLILRSAHHLFADMPMPAPAHRIVKAIGIQNDWINLRGAPNGEPIMEAVCMFVPSETESTLVDDDRYLERVGNIATYISSIASGKDVDPNTFHKMRTSLKHFLNLYRMLDLMQGDHPSTMLGRIDAINELLGQSHDGALQIADGQIGYNTSSIRIAPEIEKAILGVVREIVPV